MGGWRKPHRAEVVVGTDTSAVSRRAVEFAVHEATLRDADLVAVMSIGSGTRQDRLSTLLIYLVDFKFQSWRVDRGWHVFYSVMC